MYPPFICTIFFFFFFFFLPHRWYIFRNWHWIIQSQFRWLSPIVIIHLSTIIHGIKTLKATFHTRSLSLHYPFRCSICSDVPPVQMYHLFRCTTRSDVLNYVTLIFHRLRHGTACCTTREVGLLCELPLIYRVRVAMDTTIYLTYLFTYGLPK